MRILTGCAFVAAVCVCLVASNASAVTYMHDDGSADNAIGLGGGGVLWWANAFSAVPGGELITSIQITFGGGGYNGLANGVPFVVVLYEDTNDDGSPLGGLSLLTTANATIQFNGTDTFQTIDIADQSVSGGFFVAAVMSQASGQWPASIDQTVSAQQSWVAGLVGIAAEDLADPVGHAILGPGLIDSYGFPGNWTLRAEGAPLNGVIPEPLTLAGVTFGLAAAGAALRRRLKKV